MASDNETLLFALFRSQPESKIATVMHMLKNARLDVISWKVPQRIMYSELSRLRLKAKRFVSSDGNLILILSRTDTSRDLGRFPRPHAARSRAAQKAPKYAHPMTKQCDTLDEKCKTIRFHFALRARMLHRVLIHRDEPQAFLSPVCLKTEQVKGEVTHRIIMYVLR